jgi:hypothetical protein
MPPGATAESRPRRWEQWAAQIIKPAHHRSAANSPISAS